MAKHPSTIPAPSRTDALTNGVLEGMRKEPRQLSPVWFYDELGSFLFDVGPTDPLAFGGSALLFCAIGLIACYIPARRATAVDAMEALRYE